VADRRDFLKQVTVASMASSIPSVLSAQTKPEKKMIWANLLHLSFNMWEDTVLLKYRDENYHCNTCEEAMDWAHGYRTSLTFDEPTWNAMLQEMAKVGMNMVVIDLGDAIQYESHPEISVKNAWTPGKLKAELAKMRKLGLEPIPKLNFSTTHDTWLGKYSRMVSTDIYYDVCRDLIKEVCALFDNPRFFHLGMDEEKARNQIGNDYVVLRQNDLWWGDLYFFIGEVEKNNVRPWIWSDYSWYDADTFFKKMPKSVLQSNFWYGTEFDLNKLDELDKKIVGLYKNLEMRGYDQIPCGSNHLSPDCFGLTVGYCKDLIDASRLYGFLTASWRPTLSPCLEFNKEAINQVGNAIKKYYF
jgi:hypothetical protein